MKNAERMARQAYNISPVYDMSAFTLSSALLAQERLEEAIVSEYDL